MDFHRTRIKFCGMTHRDDIDAAIALGVDAIGLVFVPASRRCVTIEQAHALLRDLPALVQVVALVADPEPAQVDQLIARLSIDLLQFHGQEANGDCRRYGVPFVKAIAMGDDAGWRQLDRYPDARALLLDGHASGEMGGQGRAFDWNRLPPAVASRAIVAGGLNADNVATAIARLRPYAVDVSSGIESMPGRKDRERMVRFVREVRRADGECSGG